MKTALVAIDGVLRKLMGGTPIPEGIRLYQALCATGQVVLLSHDGTPQTTDWLELNGCISHSFVRICPLDFTLANQANQLRREGYDVDLVVVPVPQEATTLINAGFNSLLFTHSQYSHPDWRPDARRGVEPWQDIIDETARLAKLKAADERLRNES